MEKQLRVPVAKGWEDITEENPDGPLTCCRTNSANPGALQFSVQATYRGGKKPDPTFEDLITIASNMIKSGGGKVARTNSGECKFGKFGLVEGGLPEMEFVRIWIFSDGYDFLLASHVIVGNDVDMQEIKEGNSIVMGVDYT